MGDKMDKKSKIAVFVSGTGTNLQALLDASEDEAYPAKIELVVSDKDGIMAIDRAKKYGIDYVVVPYSAQDNGQMTADNIIAELKEHEIDWIVLAGYMRILHSNLIAAYHHRIINIHPSLLPLYGGKGFYGDRVHRAVLEDQCEYSGISIHFVDEGVDTGEIIYQEKVKIDKDESVDSLKNKIHKLEHKALVNVVKELSMINRKRGNMKRALISVSDKTGVVEFAKGLEKLGVEILSTGGTYKKLYDADIKVIRVEDYTGATEMFDGRVKTLHPKVHGGILGRRDNEMDAKQAKEFNIPWIDMVVVNLYPFKQTMLSKDATHEDKIENIDIGGPTMIRSAAKNYKDVLVVCNPEDYSTILKNISENKLDVDFRQQLAGKAFEHTAHYDAMIASYFREQNNIVFPETLTLTWEKTAELRYGENPHQMAASYKNVRDNFINLFNAVQLNGKALSYNNYNDANSALNLVKEFDKPTVVALKHANPCGVGSDDDIAKAFIKARDCDPKSIFGGIVASNRAVNEQMAEELSKIFLEVVLAPTFTDKALEILSQKENLRLLSWNTDSFSNLKSTADKFVENTQHMLTNISGGILIQDVDDICGKGFDAVTDCEPTDDQVQNLEFAWAVAKHVKSNGIVIVKNMQTIGIGVGQVNRVWAVEEAIEHSNYDVNGAVLASDGFFPFADSIEAAHKAGIKAIIQPGGSIRDEEVISKANELGIAMLFTNVRHFKH